MSGINTMVAKLKTVNIQRGYPAPHLHPYSQAQKFNAISVGVLLGVIRVVKNIVQLIMLFGLFWSRLFLVQL